MNLEERITEVLRAPVSRELRTALDLRVRAVIEGTPVPRRRRFGVARALVLAGLVGLALPGLITGGIFLTENPLGLADASEFAAEIEAAKLAVPLPPGRTWPAFFAVDDPNANYSTGGAQPWAESIATCLWLDEWLDARATEHAAREAMAASTIAEIPGWPSWESPFYDQSYRDHYRPIIEAVGRDKAAPVEAEMNLNCDWVGAE
jgi:hypothetical protein